MEGKGGLKGEWENLFSENVEIADFKIFMHKFHPTFNDAICDSTKDLTTKCEELLNMREAQEEDDRIKWKNQLEKDIPALEKDARMYEDFVQDTKFDTNVPPEETKEVLDQLNIYKVKVDDVRKNVSE